MKINTYEPFEEKLNIYTHLLGIIFSIIAGFLLIQKTIESHNKIKLIAAIIYNISLLLLYMASTLYHAAKIPSKRRLLNILDHAAIFVLIAGTYTPFAMITLKGFWGLVLLILIWTIAITGMALKFFFTGKYNTLSTILYVSMGWIAIFFIKPLMQNLPVNGIYWLIAGGIFYTVGAIFYSLEKLKFNHAIFHIWVLLGSLAHFIAIYKYVM